MAIDRLIEIEKGIFSKLGVAQVVDALQVKGRIVSEDTRSVMKIVEIGSSRVFLKVFDYRQSHKRWRYAFRKSHCLREFANFEFLASLGISCPTPLATGESRNYLRPLVSCLVTRELGDYRVLSDLLERRQLDGRQLQVIAGVLSEQVARMHEAGYIDRDLKFRNILIRLEDQLDVAHVDCAQGRLRKGLSFARGVVHDLSTLDKHAPQFLTPFQRLRFLVYYCRHRGLASHEAKRLARSVLQRRAELWRRGGGEKVLLQRRES